MLILNLDLGMCHDLIAWGGLLSFKMIVVFFSLAYKIAIFTVVCVSHTLVTFPLLIPPSLFV